MELRDYQRRAIEQMRAHVLAGKRAPLLLSPTGTGKSRMLAEVAYLHAEQGGKPLWVAPRKELLDQARATLRARGLELAWVRSNQELARKGAEIPPCTLIIADEGHHLAADTWGELRTARPDAIFVGASATPERGDGRGLGHIFDCLVEAISIRDAVAQGYLARPEVLRPERLLDPNELAQHPVDAYCEHAAGTSAVVFASSVQQALQYACAFRDRGVTAAPVWGDMPVRAREEAFASFASGETKVLTNAALAVEGVDIPRVETVILARRFGTAGGMLQAVGRGLRPFPGKSRCLVLDLVGLTHEFGEPDDERTWHLEGKAARRAGDDIDVRFCPCCGSPVVGKECEVCGHAGEMRHRPPKVLGLPIQRFARIRQDDDAARAERLAKWLRLARAKNWKEGQALHRFKAAYGEWPSRALVSRARALV